MHFIDLKRRILDAPGENKLRTFKALLTAHAFVVNHPAAPLLSREL
jgi:hypothetical protein